MRRNILNKVLASLALVLSVVMSSCSNTDYLNAIPAESTALISMDVSKISGVNNQTVLKTLLHVANLGNTGIDLSSKLYLFESSDGNLGLCARVSDEDDLENTFNGLAEKGLCPTVRKRKGYHFTLLRDSWVVGWSDKAMLVMGPVTVSAQAELQNQIAKYLGEDEDAGIKGTPMFDKLDSISAPMAMVAQAQALPDKLIAPFTLGAPKDADPSQVLIAAELVKDKDILHINGQTFSFNKRVDASLRQAAATYRKVDGEYINAMPDSALLGMFMNVDGNKFITLMRNNRGLQAMLAGINRAIDMDNILKSVDGDMSIVSTAYSDNSLKISMAARLSNAGWTGDVGYWKESCPQGGRIVDWQKNAWYYTDDKTTFFFGVTPDLQFYSGSSAQEASNSIRRAASPIDSHIQKYIKGQRLVMIINPQAIGGEKAGAVGGMLKPLFGNVGHIIYTLK